LMALYGNLFIIAKIPPMCHWVPQIAMIFGRL
jgi:hypothetical protein